MFKEDEVSKCVHEENKNWVLENLVGRTFLGDLFIELRLILEF
jgi:hypothetical protein